MATYRIRMPRLLREQWQWGFPCGSNGTRIDCCEPANRNERPQRPNTRCEKRDLGTPQRITMPAADGIYPFERQLHDFDRAPSAWRCSMVDAAGCGSKRGFSMAPNLLRRPLEPPAFHEIRIWVVAPFLLRQITPLLRSSAQQAKNAGACTSRAFENLNENNLEFEFHVQRHHQ